MSRQQYTGTHTHTDLRRGRAFPSLEYNRHGVAIRGEMTLWTSRVLYVRCTSNIRPPMPPNCQFKQSIHLLWLFIRATTMRKQSENKSTISSIRNLIYDNNISHYVLTSKLDSPYKKYTGLFKP